jgi:hypothetical protein
MESSAGPLVKRASKSVGLLGHVGPDDGDDMHSDYDPTLTELIVSDLGLPIRRHGCTSKKPWWICPFHADQNPSLTVTTNGRGWICFGCGEKGAIGSWKKKRCMDSAAPPEFARPLIPQTGAPRMSRVSRVPTLPSNSNGCRLAAIQAGPNLSWRRNAKKVLDVLLSVDSSAKAKSYLRSRGLTKSSWDAAGLKFNPTGRTIAGIFVDAGIVIPWGKGQAVQALAVRRLVGNPRFKLVKGSRRQAFYSAQDFTTGLPVVICEGELDTLLLNQVLEGVATAITFGSASARPTYMDLLQLAMSPQLLLAHDNDPAGDEAADYWLKLCPQAIRLKIPKGKDVTEAHLKKCDLKKLVQAHIDR